MVCGLASPCIDHEDVGGCLVLVGPPVECGFGDFVEVLVGVVDSPAALAGAFEVFPACPSGVGGGIDIDGEVEVWANCWMERVDALADDERGGVDEGRAFAAVRVEGPDGNAGGLAATEEGEVLGEEGKIGERGVVAVEVTDKCVVGQVVVGGDDWGLERACERGLAGADRAGDADGARGA